jgi:hypothetical protein
MLKSADYAIFYAENSPARPSSPLASDQGRHLNLYLWVLLVVTNLVDVLGTSRAFEIGIGELNPVVDVVHATFGISGLVTAKVIFLSLLFFLLPYVRTWTRALFAFACSAYLALTVAHIWYLSPLI